MAYVGTPIDTTNTFQSLTGDRFDGDGSAVAFTLSTAPASTLDIEVFVGNVRQDPNSAYTVSGTTLTFTGAPPSGTNNIYVVHQAKSVGTIDPPATETVAKTFSGATTISGALVASSTAQFDTVGIGAAKDLGTGLHIKTGDSGHGAEPHADELVIENNTNGGLTLAMGNSNSATIAFANTNSNEDGKIVYRNTERELRFHTAGTEKMRIDSAGHVTMPNQSAFSAQANAELSNIPTNNSVQTVKLGTEIFDLNADFNTGTYTFTAPVTGKYLLTFSAVLANVDSDATYMVIYIDTSNRNYQDSNTFAINGYSADEPRVEVSQTVVADMDAGDTAKVSVKQWEGTAQMDVQDDTCHFSGYLVC